MAESNAHYDAIVIGSGIGGLTTASLLSQIEHKRVLILERHFKIGGFTHTFRVNTSGTSVCTMWAKLALARCPARLSLIAQAMKFSNRLHARPQSIEP